MQRGVFQHDVCPDPGPRPLERVPVGVRTEASQGIAGNVLADLPQRWMPRRSRKHPL